jgi:hypothetical protein
MKDCFGLIKNIIMAYFGYHGLLRTFIKLISYSQILFHRKGYIHEANVKLDVNSLDSATIKK